MKALHLGHNHGEDDKRIVGREIESLLKAGYEVVYYTSENNVKEETDVVKKHSMSLIGIKDILVHPIISYRRYKDNVSLFESILAKEVPDVVHIHELLLLFYVHYIKTKHKEVTIIYDIHENYEGLYFDQLMFQTNWIIARLLCKILSIIENKAVKMVDEIITVVPYLSKKFVKINPNITEIRNYPVVDDIPVTDFSQRNNQICYCGTLTPLRGVGELCECAAEINADIYIAGGGDKTYIEESIVSSSKIYKNIVYCGLLDGLGIRELYNQSRIGICNLKKNKNQEIAFPVKLYEYMEYGLAVVCADIGEWGKVVADNECGILICPDDKDGLVKAVNYLISNPQVAYEMGKRGRNMILKEYNWKSEEKKLLKLYEKICEKL